MEVTLEGASMSMTESMYKLFVTENIVLKSVDD